MSSQPKLSTRRARARATPVRGNLSREAIAVAALAQIDRDGLEALSLRALAAALGCEAMSLYHHVQHKGDLLDAVVDVLLSEWKMPAPGSAPPRRLMMRIADSYRAVARRHPRAFVLLANRRFNTPVALAALEQVLQVLAAAGLKPREAAAGFRMIGYFLNGMGLAEVAVLATGDEPRRQVLVDAPPPVFPAVEAAGPWLGPKGLDAHYQAGMEALLDAILPA
ncbi:MAG: TetR/AcrR family transcriptional regulator C-terminal domain-containing protein [Burkholderiales bacterium]|nr:TetR/AcrR family transcriptional regulator C-terminal domain-containing protein [Burkholderiales bacterium]